MGARDRRRGRREPEAVVGRTKEKKISVAGRRKPRSPPPDGPGAVAVAPARARVAGELKRQAWRGLICLSLQAFVCIAVGLIIAADR